MRNLDMLDNAVCTQHDPEIWQNEETEAEAVALCMTGGPDGQPCPGLALCLDIGTDPETHSLTKYGVWGGMNPWHRDRIRAGRARGDDTRYQTVTFTATNRRTSVQEFYL